MKTLLVAMHGGFHGSFQDKVTPMLIEDDNNLKNKVINFRGTHYAKACLARLGPEAS